MACIPEHEEKSRFWIHLKKMVHAFLYPVDLARLEALDARTSDVPLTLQSPEQALGRFNPGCGATFGIMERCNFACTACYLGKQANQQEPLPIDKAMKQIDDIARHLGPGGNIQITSGEVTLLPKENLAELIQESHARGLSPMVMTHGDIMLEKPEYLRYLVVKGGLTKIAFHVDMTQRGRRGFMNPETEYQLNQVRDNFSGLLKRTWLETGVKLKVATTVTLNQENIHQLKDITDWFCRNLDRFRILSIQPQAKTGRTQKDNGVSGTEAWSALEKAFGMTLNAHPLLFGHPECTRLAFFLAVVSENQSFFFQAVRPGNNMDQSFMNRFLNDFRGVSVNDQPAVIAILRLAGKLARIPMWWWYLPSYALRRVWSERGKCIKSLVAIFLKSAKIRPFAFVVHSFMGRQQCETPEGKERLKACAFKLSVNGEMVSMCEMNSTSLREQTYSKRSSNSEACCENREHPISIDGSVESVIV